MLNLAGYLKKSTGLENLCLAGGVALNCVANYQLMKSGLFKNIYIQPAANDAGTALGAAYYIWNILLSQKKDFVMFQPYWGPYFCDQEIEQSLVYSKLHYQKVDNIEQKTAKLLSNGEIIGWFQGKMEWGPRALGNRSLLADPRNKNMKAILNHRIKKRESFRPFAPSVLEEDATEWFEIPKKCHSISKQFMEFAFPVKREKICHIPSVTHVDNTSRVQTVSEKLNAKYHKLLCEFKKITGVPILLNTSFNENEPIVCSPKESIETFIRTKMDKLVLGNFLVER